MYIVKCTLLSNLSQFSKGGGGGHWWDGWGWWGIIIKEKLMYNTGSKSIQSCYDKGTENELIMLIIACNKRLNFFSIYMPNPNNFYLNCPH